MVTCWDFSMTFLVETCSGYRLVTSATFLQGIPWSLCHPLVTVLTAGPGLFSEASPDPSFSLGNGLDISAGERLDLVPWFHNSCQSYRPNDCSAGHGSALSQQDSIQSPPGITREYNLELSASWLFSKGLFGKCCLWRIAWTRRSVFLGISVQHYQRAAEEHCHLRRSPLEISQNRVLWVQWLLCTPFACGASLV